MAGHFYTTQGEPQHELSLSEARKKGCVPSSTTVIGELRNEALEIWRLNQAIKLTLEESKDFSKTEATIVQKVNGKLFSSQSGAANTGNILHGVLEKYGKTGEWEYEKIPGEFHESMAKAKFLVDDLFIINDAEVTFANTKHWYGGQADAIGLIKEKDGTTGDTFILDYKSQFPTRALKSGEPSFTMYHSHAMQLASYRLAIGIIPGYEAFRQARCFNLMISTNPFLPGVRIHEWLEVHQTKMNLQRAERMFIASLNYYQEKYNMKPEPELERLGA